MRSQEAIQKRIYELCDSRNMSVNALCRISGITQSTIGNIMSGRNVSTTVSTIQKLCDGLDINLAIFFDTDYFRDLEQEIY